MNSEEMLKKELPEGCIFHNRSRLGEKPDWVIVPSKKKGEIQKYLIIYEDNVYGAVYENFKGTFKEALIRAKEDGRSYQIKV